MPPTLCKEMPDESRVPAFICCSVALLSFSDTFHILRKVEALCHACQDCITRNKLSKWPLDVITLWSQWLSIQNECEQGSSRLSRGMIHESSLLEYCLVTIHPALWGTLLMWCQWSVTRHTTFYGTDNSIDYKNITYIIALIVADPILILNQHEIDYKLNVYI